MSCTLIPSAIHVSELLDELYKSAEHVAEHETSDMSQKIFKTIFSRQLISESEN